MKKSILLVTFCCLYCFTFSQSKIVNKFSTETLVSFGYELEFGCMGIEVGQQLNYSLLDRFGFYTSLGGFHSFGSAEHNGIRSNSSAFLWDLNAFGDIISTKKGHRLRLAAGATYFNGILAFDAITNDDEPVFMQTYYYNNIGINVNLSYHCPLTEKWYLGINFKIYDRCDGVFLDYMTFGCSVGYNF